VFIEAKDDGGVDNNWTTGAPKQSSSQIITTNKPTPSLFTGRMPFLSPNEQCQSTEGKLMKFTVMSKLTHSHYAGP